MIHKVKINGIITEFVVSCLLLTALLGCAVPRRTLYGTGVLAVKSISDVLQCEYKGTITAVIHPSGKHSMRSWNHPVNSRITSELIVDAKNRSHEIKANRILERSRPFKGSQQFDMFYCPQPSPLNYYAQSIDAREWEQQNLARHCGYAGPAQCADYAELCGKSSPLATAREGGAAAFGNNGLGGTLNRTSCTADPP